MGHHEHRLEAPLHVPTAVLTVSDTRTPRTDRSGKLIRRLLREAGHPLVWYRILPDEPARIRRTLRAWGEEPRLGAVILTGGTGVSARDGTSEVVEKLITKRLEGFGELFRMLSYRQVGSAAFLSRAVAGIYRNKAVFSLPGSEKAVKLAMEKLILPELCHLAYELAKSPSHRGRASLDPADHPVPRRSSPRVNAR